MLLREARRFFRASPLLSCSGMLILALGIGSSTIMLALLCALSSLTYPGMRALGYATIAEQTEGGGSIRISWQRLESLRSAPHPGSSLAAYSDSFLANLTFRGTTRSVKIAAASRGFFSVFTPPLIAGHDFTPSDETTSEDKVAILSASLSSRLFQSPSAAIGSMIMLSGSAYQVIGVAPRHFHGLFNQSADLWISPSHQIDFLPGFSSGQFLNSNIWKQVAFFYGVAASSHHSSGALAKELSRGLPLRLAGQSPLHVSQGLTIDPVSDMKTRRWFRVGFLLALAFTLISSLNYSLLLLARMPRNAQEARLRKALGASRSRLALDLTVGPAAMILAALVVATTMVTVCAFKLPQLLGSYAAIIRASQEAAITALSFQFLFAGFLTVTIALLPVVFVLRDNGMPRASYTATPGKRTDILILSPVILQMALCSVIWIFSGMVVASLLNIVRRPLGYDLSNLTVIQISMTTQEGISGGGKLGAFPSITSVEAVLDRLKAIPGVQDAGYAAMAPLDDRDPPKAISIERAGQSGTQTPRTVYWNTVTPSYFRTLHSGLLGGSNFSSTIHPILRGAGTRDIIVNRTLSAELWPGGNPIGQLAVLIYPAAWGMPSTREQVRIIGTSGDIRDSGLTASPEPTLFFSEYQADNLDTGPEFVVRGPASLHSLEDAVRPLVHTLMPGLDVTSAYSISDRLRDVLQPERRRAAAALCAALMMALLSAAGLYSSLTYYVQTMRRTLAVRICFGASSSDIRKIVLKRAATCTGIAAILSIPLWIPLAGFSSSEYLGQLAWSTPRAIVITILYICVAVSVAIRPALAASRISPSEALKEQ